MRNYKPHMVTLVPSNAGKPHYFILSQASRAPSDVPSMSADADLGFDFVVTNKLKIHTYIHT